MKVSPTENFLTNVRNTIEMIRNRLLEIKQERKSLISDISKAKLQIRSGEKCCSIMRLAKLDDSHVSYVRKDIHTKRQSLAELRQTLLTLDVSRKLELSRFRVLHQTLDELKVPFNPEAKNKK